MTSTVDRLLQQALEEDVPKGDITSQVLLEKEMCEVTISAASGGIVSGTQHIKRLYQLINPEIMIKMINDHGVWVDNDTIIMIIYGSAKDVLSGLDIARNLLTRLSGIATKTNQYVKQLEGTKTLLLDNRLNTPNFRVFEKEAVLDGGGINHRMSLSDHAVIQPYHLRDDITLIDAINTLKERVDETIKIEVVITTYEDYLEALNTPCDIIRLHNMTKDTIKRCLETSNDKLLIATHESTELLVDSIAKTGIEFIMIPSITENYTPLKINVQIR